MKMYEFRKFQWSLLLKIQFDNIPALVQIITSADQATSHYQDQWWLAYRLIYASLALNELSESLCEVNTNGTMVWSIKTFSWHSIWRTINGRNMQYGSRNKTKYVVLFLAMIISYFTPDIILGCITGIGAMKWWLLVENPEGYVGYSSLPYIKNNAQQKNAPCI